MKLLNISLKIKKNARSVSCILLILAFTLYGCKGDSVSTLLDDYDKIKEGTAEILNPSVQFRSGSQIVSENAGSASMDVDLSEKYSQDITVPYTVSGTAVNGTHHDLSDGSLTIAAGETTGKITFNITDNSTFEEDKTIIVTFGTFVIGEAGSTTTHTITISSDDAIPEVNFSSAAQAVTESAGSATIDVSLSAASELDGNYPVYNWWNSHRGRNRPRSC